MATPQAAQGSEAAENPQAHGGATSPDLPIGTDRSVNERYWRWVARPESSTGVVCRTPFACGSERATEPERPPDRNLSVLCDARRTLRSQKIKRDRRSVPL